MFVFFRAEIFKAFAKTRFLFYFFLRPTWNVKRSELIQKHSSIKSDSDKNDYFSKKTPPVSTSSFTSSHSPAPPTCGGRRLLPVLLLVPLHGAVVAQHHLPQCLAQVRQAGDVAVQGDVLQEEKMKRRLLVGTEVSPAGRDAPHHADLPFFNLTNWQDEQRLSVHLHFLIKIKLLCYRVKDTVVEEAVDLRMRLI